MPTGFQSFTHSLRVGVPMAPIYLANYTTPACQKYAIVQGFMAKYSDPSLMPPGLSMSSAGVISGTPTTAGAYICKARGYRGTRNPEASWAARSAGAYHAQRFDSAAPLTGGTGINFSSWDQTPGNFRSGVGSMLQYIPANPQVNDCSKWFFSTKVAQDYVNGTPGFASNTGFNLGETFYIQFGFRPDRYFVQWPWPTTPKITIADMLPWNANLNLGPTANPWEVVSICRLGYFYGYRNGPAGGQPGPPNALDNEGWTSNVGGGGELVRQSNIFNTGRVLNGDNPGLPSGGGPAWTTSQQTRAAYGYLYQAYESLNEPDGITDPISAGVSLDILQWHTLLMGITVDTAYGAGNGRVTWWVAPEGQDYIKIFDKPYVLNITNPTSPLFVRDSNQPFGGQDTVFPGVDFTNLAFIDAASDPTSAAIFSTKPYTSYNIDEIICHSSMPPSPDIGDGTSNYRTQDVLLTFKVNP